MPEFRIEALAGQDRKNFSCGSERLDRYFREQVTQDIKRRIVSCFVALDVDDAIVGFYTLSATSIAFDKLPLERARKLPRYPTVPGALLGRLAVATSHRGQKLGISLVADAMLRAARSDVAAHMMLVDAKDETAARFYEHLGFLRLAVEPLRLIIPL